MLIHHRGLRLLLGTSVFQRPTAALWRRRRGDGGARAGMFRDQVSVMAEPIAGAFDLNHDGMMQEPIQKRGRDDRIPKGD